MAIGTTTALALGLGAAGLGGSLWQASQDKEARQQGRTDAAQNAAYLRRLMQQSPTAGERQISGFYGDMRPTQLPGITSTGDWLNKYGFNQGQDAILQSMRADPRTKVDETLEGIIGQRFDTSDLFEKLGIVDQRALDTQLSQQRGAFSSGLGQRFGSASQNAEARLREGALANQGARNAQIAMAAYESGLERDLAAASQLTGREQFGRQFGLQSATQLQSAGIAAGGLGQQNEQAMAQLSLAAQQGDRDAQIQLLGMIQEAETQRLMNNNALAMSAASLGGPLTSVGLGVNGEPLIPATDPNNPPPTGFKENPTDGDGNRAPPGSDPPSRREPVPPAGPPPEVPPIPPPVTTTPGGRRPAIPAAAVPAPTVTTILPGQFNAGIVGAPAVGTRPAIPTADEIAMLLAAPQMFANLAPRQPSVTTGPSWLQQRRF